MCSAISIRSLECDDGLKLELTELLSEAEQRRQSMCHDAHFLRQSSINSLDEPEARSTAAPAAYSEVSAGTQQQQQVPTVSTTHAAGVVATYIYIYI